MHCEGASHPAVSETILTIRVKIKVNFLTIVGCKCRMKNSISTVSYKFRVENECKKFLIKKLSLKVLRFL